MNIKNWQIIFFSFCLILSITACMPVFSSFMKINEEQFLVLAVLGEEGKADNYYPNEDNTIRIGDSVRWIIYLSNEMDELKYVAIRIKLLNSTIEAPNSTSCIPSPAATIYEVRHMLMDDETWLYPLNWNILNASVNDESISIKSLIINNVEFQTNVKADYGYSFRIVIELWIYDDISQSFNFHWVSRQELNCAWNQIWFNVDLSE